MAVGMTKPCPECAKRFPPLKPASAPLPDCKCRLCNWLRSNAEYVKRG